MITRGRLAFLLSSVLLVLLLAAGTMGAATPGQGDGADSLYKYLSVFTEVLGLVDRAYVDDTDQGVLLSGAYEGVVDALDPFSLYVPAAALPRYLGTRERALQRSGLQIFKERGVAYLLGVAEGSPAAKAGLERGDVLSILQGVQTRPMPLYDILSVLAGEPGTEIQAERLRLGQTDTVKLTLGDFPPPAVRLSSRDGSAVLRIPVIDAATAGQVKASLDLLADPEGGLEVADRGRLLLDLRSTAQGDAEGAYAIARLFAAGELGALLGRGKELAVYQGDAEPVFRGSDLVILVDRGTQGAAEVLATVLHQSAGAALVGERTFGHCGRQELIELSNGDRLQLTTAFYAGADRKPLRGALVPDVLVAGSPFEDDTAASDDAILKRGLEVLREGAASARKPAAETAPA